MTAVAVRYATYIVAHEQHGLLMLERMFSPKSLEPVGASLAVQQQQLQQGDRWDCKLPTLP